MNRKERILEALTQYDGTDGVDAATLSLMTGIDRANISRELNLMVREGMLEKSSGRPVRYSLKGQELEPEEQKSDEFQFIMGEDGALASQVKQAKAAILYPPKGLHTLLIGQTGVGKTTFAERMYAYAVHMKVVSNKAEFVSFNCAEYAENSQLLLAQLFGYVKGAFTGADRDKTGLVDKAEGGILFLDEIHRLPAEGQEILFHLIDKGTFRRMGETGNTHHSNVLIIGATTENPEKALLGTFVRRIPMTIELPSLEELPTIMRLQLIESFFQNEQKNIGVPIEVEKEVLLALLLYQCPGNIGQLKADVQLLCARSFLDYKISESDRLSVGISKLQSYIEKGMVKRNHITDDVVDFIDHSMSDIICYEGADNSEPLSDGVYTEIAQKYNQYKKRGRSNSEIGEMLGRNLMDYIDELQRKYLENGVQQNALEENVMKVLGEDIYQPVREILQFAEIKLERPISPKLRVGFAMHVNALMERIDKGVPIKNNKLDEIIKEYPKEYKLAQVIGRLLEGEFKKSIPKEEVGFLALFLRDDRMKSTIPKIGVVVITHGEHTATGMADFVNKLLGVEHCRSIDMPIDQSVDETLEIATNEVKLADEGKGVMLLVDMGSLKNFGEIISHRNKQKVICIDMVSTLTLIEAVRKAVLDDMTLEALAAYLRTVPIYANQFRKEEVEETETKTIIATCVSGQGSARKIGEMLFRIIPEGKKEYIRIEYMDLDAADHTEAVLAEKDIHNVVAVVGTVDIGLVNVPFISVDELLQNDGIQRVRSILDIYTEEMDITQPISNEILINTLKGILNYLDPEKVLGLIGVTMNTIAERLGLVITKESQIRYVVHVACMIERLLKGEVLPYKYLEEKKKQSGQMFEELKESLLPIEEMWTMEIPETEIAYLAEIIEKMPQKRAR